MLYSDYNPKPPRWYKLSAAQIEDIRRMRREGWPPFDIGVIFGIPKRYIQELTRKEPITRWDEELENQEAIRRANIRAARSAGAL